MHHHCHQYGYKSINNVVKYTAVSPLYIVYNYPLATLNNLWFVTITLMNDIAFCQNRERNKGLLNIRKLTSVTKDITIT